MAMFRYLNPRSLASQLRRFPCQQPPETADLAPGTLPTRVTGGTAEPMPLRDLPECEIIRFGKRVVYNFPPSLERHIGPAGQRHDREQYFAV
jgi:hypothetical protein